MSKEIENHILDLNREERLPSPIRPIACKCGCGHVFQPRRKDQLYIDKTHYDFNYNQTKRKVKHKNIVEIEKILRTNNRILEKHYKANLGNLKKDSVRCYFEILKAEGFKTANYIGIEERNKMTYQCLYDYKYRLYKNKDNKLIVEITV